MIQADGGTRTASITGAAVALVDAMNVLLENKKIKQDPLKRSWLLQFLWGCIKTKHYLIFAMKKIQAAKQT